MNRLQKKCVLATVGFHLLLLVILFVGPAFFSPRPKVDDSQVLDVIPANLIDAQFTSGVKNAQPPASTPVSVPPPQPTAPAPKQVVTPPTFTEKLENFFKAEPATPLEKLLPEDLKSVDNSTKPQTHKIRVDLTRVTREVSKNSATDNSQNSQNNARALKNMLRSLQHNLSSATEIDMPGNSSVAYANYASVVKSIYEHAWTPPDDTSSDDANTKVSVTIASDGTVISARIIGASDDSGVDATVQRTLDRVTVIAPFPEGVQEKQRTYIINFNLKAKRMLE